MVDVQKGPFLKRGNSDLQRKDETRLQNFRLKLVVK